MDDSIEPIVMTCRSCQFENPAGMRFCGGCGASLARACPGCGVTSPPEFQFCGACGTSLAAKEPESQAEAVAEASPGTDFEKSPTDRKITHDAERRHITVLFADLVDSTQLAEEIDPEELRELVRSYQAAAGQVIRDLDGHVAQYLGDGILVYFGFPKAHEDDPRRGVEAGLGIVDAVRALGKRVGERMGIELAVRVGIHAGTVVAGAVGDGVTRERLALGPAPNVAARLQSLAQPNEVILSSAIHSLTEGFFSFERMGSHTLKGVSEPQKIYKAIRTTGILSSFDVVAGRGLRPMVGREAEVQLLEARLKQTEDGRGQAVLIRADAGLGKSRLAHSIRGKAGKAGFHVLIGQCSEHRQASPLHPIVSALEQQFQFATDDTEAIKRKKVRKILEKIDPALLTHAPSFDSLLDIVDTDSDDAATSRSQERQKVLMQQAMTDCLLAIARRQPILLIVEDVHWADPSSQDFLELYVRIAPETRLYVLLTARPGFGADWAASARLLQVNLDRLSSEETEELVLAVAGGKSLPEGVLEHVITRTDGVPLFAEELTRMLLESGLLVPGQDGFELTGTLDQQAIPTTLEDSLMARLDRLAGTKEVVQVAALIGRDFTHELLAAVSGLDEASLNRSLDQLVDAELLFRQGLAPDSIYAFKHGLIQDSASRSLLRADRQAYHRRIAGVLIDKFPAITESQPDRVAEHLTRAKSTEQAVDWWLRAGHRALERSAQEEAVGLLSKGLELVRTLSGSPERDQIELRLQSALGPALVAVKGYGMPEVERAYARAEELCNEAGSEDERYWVLLGLYFHDLARSELDDALEFGDRLVTTAEEIGDQALVAAAHDNRGIAQFFRANMEDALVEFELGSHGGGHAQDSATTYRARAGTDYRVQSLAVGSVALWHLGKPDASLERSREALALAREIEHPYSLALAMVFAGTELHHHRHDAKAILEHTEELAAISDEYGYVTWQVQGTFFSTWAHIQLTEPDVDPDGDLAKMETMRSLIRQSVDMGVTLASPYFLSMLAEACLARDRLGEAESALSEALSTSHRTGERIWEPEIHRLKGLLSMAGGAEDPEVEAHFRAAVTTAREVNSQGLLLRGATELARFLHEREQSREALALLSPIHAWFTEGKDTKDYLAAADLLGTLQGEASPGQQPAG